MTKSEKSLRQALEHTLQWSKKIYHLRCDRFSREQQAYFLELQIKLQRFKQEWLENDPIPTGLNTVLAEMESQLKNFGKPFYPINFWSDHAEIIWVAAFVALTIRTFFIQPFRIPTCSMFPSFSGMLTQLHDDTKPRPNFFIKPFRWLLHGAESHHYIAPCNGRIQIPIFSPADIIRRHSYIRYEIEQGREIGPFWLKYLLPKPYKVYSLWIENKAIHIRVPFEFTDMEALLRRKFFPQYSSFDQVLESIGNNLIYDEQKGYCLNTSFWAEKGKPCLHFDIIAGDMVFVDRLTYHFRRPQIGEAIVFRTQHIELLGKNLYYIKRLVGHSGDILNIYDFGLFRNGAPITGSFAFEANAKRKGLYPGYEAKGLLNSKRSYAVSHQHFFSLGDNSPFSYDSRFWGEIPEKDVIGKAAFILHPLSWRWGRAEKDKSNSTANPQDFVFK